MEEPYNNRELNHYFTDLFGRMDKQDKKLSQIDDKVGFQNGRVTKLEVWTNEAKTIIEANNKTISSYKVDKARIYTLIGVLTLVSGAIISLALIVIQDKINKGIQTAFDNYVENVTVSK